MTRLPSTIDITTFMALADIIAVESVRQNLTITKLLKESRARKVLRDQEALYRYVAYGQAQCLIRIVRVADPRPFGEAKYYYLTAAGDRLLQVWQERKKEEKEKNGN